MHFKKRLKGRVYFSCERWNLNLMSSDKKDGEKGRKGKDASASVKRKCQREERKAGTSSSFVQSNRVKEGASEEEEK